MPRSPAVSIIIPVLNESAAIVPTLQRLAALREQGVEVIVVDGDSTDDTRALAAPFCDQLVVSARGRAVQMNCGAEKASGDVLLFLHGDTVLAPDAASRLHDFMSSDRAWGRFDVRLSGNRRIYRVIAFMMNLRSRLTGIATGDQGIFVRRSVLDTQGGYREMPLMEDIELCRRLKRVSRPFCVASPVITDSRRWEQNGACRTIWLMWRLRWRYWRGADPGELARAYRADVRRGRSEAGPA
ncbi:TIGR04283 family arsenosugar biosynthesis glycosyltransferase [Marinobacter bryozoorum]|uniref:TIGR04283 family arsenosugar biosynthesis glycosyltransferase n=1 Tax=Marinobacter bryozoorum TaxID=256324 RepID=UPI0020064CA2|nr:TIGR04283 family arsenosugar biosynthesis glycosyltransferase [Marinobacter bryozoorum]